MDVVFFIGNGFDLQLGMKTSYRQFLELYTSLPSSDRDIAEFREYLRSDKGEWWSDAELGMGQYLGHFSDNTLNTYFKRIRDFKLKLAEYLDKENEDYDVADSPLVIEAFKDFLLHSTNDVMLHSHKLHLNELRRNNDTFYHFITFNYTDALDRIIEACGNDHPLEQFEKPTLAGKRIFNSKLGTVIHVHGTLRSSLIMGVDNPTQLNSVNIQNYSKLNRTMLKPLVNDELGRDEVEAATNLIDNSSFLFFYGLSFGETDKTWWDKIRQKIVTDANCQVIVFNLSSDEEINPLIPEDVLDYVNNVKEDFLAKLGILRDDPVFDTVRKRVFIIRNTKRLDISRKRIHQLQLEEKSTQNDALLDYIREL